MCVKKEGEESTTECQWEGLGTVCVGVGYYHTLLVGVGRT